MAAKELTTSKTSGQDLAERIGAEVLYFETLAERAKESSRAWLGVSLEDSLAGLLEEQQGILQDILSRGQALDLMRRSWIDLRDEMGSEEESKVRGKLSRLEEVMKDLLDIHSRCMNKVRDLHQACSDELAEVRSLRTALRFYHPVDSEVSPRCLNEKR